MGELTSFHRQTHFHAHKIIFFTPAGAAEVINIQDCAAIKVRPGNAARTQAFFTVCLHKADSGFANLGRQKEKFALPF